MVVPVMPPAFSGAGRRACLMAQAFAQRGHKVLVLTHTAATPRTGEGGVEVAPLRSWRFRNTFPKRHPLRAPTAAAAAASTVVEARSALRRFRPDVVLQVGCDFGPQLSGFAAQTLGLPLVSEMTLLGSDDVTTIRSGPRAGFRMRVLRRSAAVVGISPPLHATALAEGLEPSRCWVIANGVDTQHFRPADVDERAQLRKAVGLPADAQIIVSVGRISPRKGMLELARVFLDTVLPAASRAHLVLVGPYDSGCADAEYVRAVRQLADEASSRGRITLTSEVSDVAPWLRLADVFAFASRAEGFPNALVEAMACGLPMVAQPLDGTSRFIFGPDTMGTEIVTDDTAMGPALLRALECRHEPEKVAALQRRAVEHFSDERIVGQYLQLFEVLTSEQQR